MKKFLIVLPVFLLSLVLFAQVNQKPAANPKLKVYYFHLTNRCPTCIKIEATTKKVLEENFKAQLDNGTIVFQSFNVDVPANKAICEKYQAYGATLALTYNKDNKEKIEDLTNFAFAKIHTEAAFVNELKIKINSLIK